MSEIEKQISVIKRNTSEIIEESELREKLRTSLEKNIPLRVKYGIDPTAPDIHIGHTVPIKKLQELQNLGHKILFLIGDFTAKIGDPTGRNETRPILSDSDIKTNLARYKEQAGKILNIEKTEFVYNSHWLSGLNLEEAIRLTSVFTVAQILEREDFSKRYKGNLPIFLQEFLYPLLQGYDSYELKADIEIGATEQKFNLLAGRTIQESYGQKKQVVITMPILVGTDGKMKMSKTYNNHIPVGAEPADMFGKVMSIPDSLMEEYLLLLTSIDIKEWSKIAAEDPRNSKILIAKDIVRQYYGIDKALEAEEAFNRIFSRKEAPADIPVFEIKEGLSGTDGRFSPVDIIHASGMASSKSEARRLIIQKAVKIDDEVIEDPQARIELKDGQVIKAGKRKFIKIKTM